MAFHCKDINFRCLAYLANKLFEPGFYAFYKKYFSPVARAKNKMIVQQRYGSMCSAKGDIHVSIIYLFWDERLAIHPTAHAMGFLSHAL